MLTRYAPLKRTAFKRKPQATKKVTLSDREICTGEEWERRRAETHARAQGICEWLRRVDIEGRPRTRRCSRNAPLHDERDSYGEVIRSAGHAHHKRRRGMGGGKRNDSLSNLQWVCANCHKEAHTPIKVIPKKGG